jgi:hypothetical protein
VLKPNIIEKILAVKSFIGDFQRYGNRLVANYFINDYNKLKNSWLDGLAPFL